MKIIHCKTDEEYLALEDRAAKFMELPTPWIPRYALPPEETDRKFIVTPKVAHLFEDQNVEEGEMLPLSNLPDPAKKTSKPKPRKPKASKTKAK